MVPPDRRRSAPGRPEATSHAAIEQAAFGLFAEHGFERTTTEMIAAAVGIGRRTLFRYYESKNDIPWGQFDDSLVGFRRLLDQTPADVGVQEAVHRGVREFNRFSPGVPSHRDRMELILTTPALQAHSAVRYADWRRVIEEFVAARLGLSAKDLLPVTVGHTALGTALAAYAVWLEQPTTDLVALIDEAFRGLRGLLGE